MIFFVKWKKMSMLTKCLLEKDANNNISDLIMTNEKIKIWKKEFTFWDTEDGKVIINSHLNFYSFINFFSHEECLEISCSFLFLFSLYKLKVGYLFFFTDFFFFFDISNFIFLICTNFFFYYFFSLLLVEKLCGLK